VTIEKAFAIVASQADIWDALWHELGDGEEGRFAVLHSNWPNEFTLSLELAGLPVQLNYEISPRDGFCEVAARLEPAGLRYALYQILTFGHFRRNYELLLAQGLLNLKTALEGPPSDSPEGQETGG
jgi:hypothetical protein